MSAVVGLALVLNEHLFTRCTDERCDPDDVRVSIHLAEVAVAHLASEWQERLATAWEEGLTTDRLNTTNPYRVGGAA